MSVLMTQCVCCMFSRYTCPWRACYAYVPGSFWERADFHGTCTQLRSSAAPCSSSVETHTTTHRSATGQSVSLPTSSPTTSVGLVLFSATRRESLSGDLSRRVISNLNNVVSCHCVTSTKSNQMLPLFSAACDEWRLLPKPDLHRDVNRFGHSAVVSNGWVTLMESVLRLKHTGQMLHTVTSSSNHGHAVVFQPSDNTYVADTQKH